MPAPHQALHGHAALRPGSRRRLALAYAVVLGVAAALAGTVQAAGPARDPGLGMAAAAPGLGAFAVAPGHQLGSPPPPRQRISEGQIVRGKSLSELLRADGVEPRIISQIARGMRGHFDFRRSKAGHGYRLVQDADGALVEFQYRVSAIDGYTLRPDGQGMRVTRHQAALEPRSTRIAGIITSTLYESITDLGEDGQLARDFADVFAWDIDFQRAVQPGDSYQILYERLYRREGGRDVYVRPGRILVARFQGAAGAHTAVYFEASEGRGGYYRPNGSSVEGMFLMAPLRHARITSSYSAARRHPILKVTRPHRGIDYAAAAGTPVWSVAGGTVVHRGWSGANGNLVKVEHANGFVSYYAHLSRYASGLSVGDRVEQKQVIGYVGQTGLATGPHVCFRIQMDGDWVNPARLRIPSGAPIPGELVPRFRAARDQLLAELSGDRRLASSR